MIIYRTSAKGITAKHLKGFFVGWPNHPDPPTHLRLLRNSDFVVIARDERTKRVIGFVTAVSDGVLAAYIPFLEVLPKYQHRGIGTKLIKKMLSLLKGLYMIDLMCDADIQSFYARAGMAKGVGMMMRNSRRRSGKR